MIVTFDFETDPIEPRPKYPPEPHGLALKLDDAPSMYFAWGHPTENNSTKAHVDMVLQKLIEDPTNYFVAHNLAFDAAIVEVKFGLKFPWNRSADTMLLAFLYAPYGELSLKPLAEKHLGLPPTEQDAVREWLIRHGIVRSTDKNWGAHICKAPGDLVGRYACGDTDRTYELYHFFTKPEEVLNANS